MTIDIATVTKIASLSRLKVEEADKPALADQLNQIFDFVAQLDAVDVSTVAPMTGCQDMVLRPRDDVVNDGGSPDTVLDNAPQRTGDFFVVPKVLE